MSLLHDAAVAWSKMYNTKYEFLLGQRNKSERVILTFSPEDFPHLAGMQYANGVDFGIRRAEVMSQKFVQKVIDGNVNVERIEKAEKWNQIEGRLSSIIDLECALDSDFEIRSFNPKRTRHGTTIEARYVIKSNSSKLTFFLFVDEASGRWFCRSIFRYGVVDFTDNQSPVAVLKKRKYVDNELIIDYISPSYKP